jgi:glyoxylase-like metal-dependent hydrolase (beta-lactamase superfamily II)
MLSIVPLILGPVATNAYLIADSESGEAAVIDPAWDGNFILDEAKKRGWRIGQIWITHAHFDHIGGTGDLVRGLDSAPIIAMHPSDRLLWKSQGGAARFGFSLPPSPAPDLDLEHGMDLQLSGLGFEVRHAPGHTPGLCVFYCAQAAVCFTGDLIFQNSVGRTDLPGGNWAQLLESIRTQIFTLPEETQLLSGHGPETSVGEEKRENPFVRSG